MTLPAPCSLLVVVVPIKHTVCCELTVVDPHRLPFARGRPTLNLVLYGGGHNPPAAVFWMVLLSMGLPIEKISGPSPACTSAQPSVAKDASMIKRLAACAVLASTLAARPLRAERDPGERTILNHMTFWRQHYTLDGAVMRKGEELEKIRLASRGSEVAKWLNMETALPPQDWQQPDFDDSRWLRKPVSNPDSPWVKLLCLRGRFRVEDPQKAAGLSLSLRYRGGVTVYLNGKEIGRGHLSASAASNDLAEDYPATDFMKVRELAAIPLPPNELRKGVNVLAIEVHRSAQPDRP